MLFTQTWFHPEIPDCLIKIEVFSYICSDRNTPSGKSKGGVLCLYINDKWCRATLHPNVELLCVILRLFYLPRVFGDIVVCSVYVLLGVNAWKATTYLAACGHKQLQCSNYTLIFIMEDLYHCNWKTILPCFEKCIKCEEWCGNVNHTYAAMATPSLFWSQHWSPRTEQ